MLNLNQFTGTEHWYRHSFNRNVTYTDGVKYVADEAGAYWLIDEIALAQFTPRIKAEEFQVWKLNVIDRTATLTVEDGDGKDVCAKHIDFTDFPAPGITLWLANNRDSLSNRGFVRIG